VNKCLLCEEDIAELNKISNNFCVGCIESSPTLKDVKKKITILEVLEKTNSYAKQNAVRVDRRDVIFVDDFIAFLQK
jgi:UDP-N-acetylglucosamine enolpyruvyl transferase